MASVIKSIFRSFNSASLTAKMTRPFSIPEGAERATVAAGCFWGVEHMYRKHFGPKGGLYDARVGYIGGDTEDPSYKSVCSGNTGHAEATLLIYDPTKITYTQILEFFYKMHDATQLNQQGPDRGTQYRSGIFYHTEEQKKNRGGDHEKGEWAVVGRQDCHRDPPRKTVVGCGGLSPGVFDEESVRV